MTVDKIILWFMAIGVLIGALDKITGNHFKLGDKMDQGFHAMGPLGLGMVGIICLSPLIAKGLRPVLTPICSLFGMDPCLPAAFLGADMGGYVLAMELANDIDAARYIGLVVSSSFGATLVFTIPVGLSLLKKEYHGYFSQGLLVGLISIPFGCFVGGMTAGMDAIMLLKNTWLITIFSLLIALGMKCIPTKMIKGCMIFGKLITIVLYVGLGCGAFTYITGVTLIPGMTPIEDAMVTIAAIGIVLLGTFPFLEILTRILNRPLKAIGQKVGMNDDEVAGIMCSIANPVPVFTMMNDMSPKGIIINTAWAVPIICALGDLLGFIAGVDRTMIVPMVVSKFVAGGIALLLIKVTGIADKKYEV